MFELVYVASALVVLTSLAYRIARGEPLTRVTIGGSAVAVASLLAYAVLQGYAPMAMQKVEQSIQALDAAYRCFSQTVATVSTAAFIALSVVFAVLAALSALTAGLSKALALMIAEAAAAAINSYVDAVAYWLGHAASMAGVLKAALTFGPAVSAALVPLVAAYTPSRRSAFAAAYLSLVPWMMALAAYLAPVVEPMPAFYCQAQAPPMPPGQAVVKLESPYPTVFLFYANYSGWRAVWIAQGPGEVLLLAPANYTAKAVWMWTWVPVAPQSFALRPQNATAVRVDCDLQGPYNGTCAVAGYNGTALTVVAHLPKYDEVDDWNYAVTPRPSYRKWVDVGSTDKAPRLALVWEYTYRCYGYASECPVETYRIFGIGLFWNVFVSTRGVSYAELSYSAAVADVKNAVSQEEWRQICDNATGTCPRYPASSVYGVKYSGPREMAVSLAITPTPHIVCEQVNGTTQCREVPDWHTMTVNVTAVLYDYGYYVHGVAGFYAANGNATFNTAMALAVLQQLLLGSSYERYLSLIPANLPINVAKNFVEQVLIRPALWIVGEVVPWFITVAFLELLILGSALGIGILVGADAVLPRLVHFEELMKRARYSYDPFGYAFRAAARTATAAGAGASPYSQIYASTYASPYKAVADAMVKTADMAKLYLATAAKVASLAWTGDVLDFAFAFGGIAALLPHAWREVFVPRTSPLAPAQHALAALGRAVHLYFTPSGHPVAGRIHALAYYLNMALRLRLEAFSRLATRHLQDAYRSNLALFGHRLTATAATLLFLRALTPTEGAAFALAMDLPSRYFPVVPRLVARELKFRYGYVASESDVLRGWFARTGHDPRVVDFFLAVAKVLGEDKEKYLNIAANAPSLRREAWEAYARLVPEELLPVAERYAPGVMDQELLRRYSALQLDFQIFEAARGLVKGTKPAEVAAEHAKELYPKAPEEAWKALYGALAERLDQEARRAAGGYDVLVFKGYAYVKYGGTFTREDVERLRERGLVITGEAWRDFGGEPPENAPVVWRGDSVDVNYLWLAHRGYSVVAIPSEKKMRVDFGGSHSLDEVLEYAMRTGYELTGEAAPYIERILASPAAIAEAIKEVDRRKEVEEAAEYFFRSLSEEERELVSKFVREVAEGLQTTLPTSAHEQPPGAEASSPEGLLPATEELGPVKAPQGQTAKLEELARQLEQLTELAPEQQPPHAEQLQASAEERPPLMPPEASSVPEELARPEAAPLQPTEVATGEAPTAGQLQSTPEPSVPELPSKVEQPTEAPREPLPHAVGGPPGYLAEEPVAWRVYREAAEKYGIDATFEVVERYVEKYGEEALDALVRDAAKMMASAYGIPYAAEAVEELIRKYGAEEASRLVAQAKKEARETGEDIRDVLRRY